MKTIETVATALVVGTLLSALSGCDDAMSAGAPHASPTEAAGPVDRVTAGRPIRKSLMLYTSQPGRVQAFEETPLVPKVAGYVEEVLVDIGDSVQKGQKLIQLWIPEMHDELAQKEALIAQAEAEVKQAQAAAMQPLLVVARTDLVRVFVDVPEMEAPLVDGGEGGDMAIIRVQSLRDREFEAKVTRTSWALDASNRSLRTEIDIPNDDGLLRPGMYATATILLERRNDVLTLPITAIVRDGQESFCLAVESGKINRKPISLGLRSGDEVELVSGLDEDDNVVLARTDNLQHGTAGRSHRQ